MTASVLLKTNAGARGTRNSSSGTEMKVLIPVHNGIQMKLDVVTRRRQNRELTASDNKSDNNSR